METCFYKSPIGFIQISGDEAGISSVAFLDDVKAKDEPIADCLKDCYNQLDEYFKQKRKSFDLKLNPESTDFQKIVWNELIKIPFGTTQTYLDIARKTGDEKNTRAVGNANNKNKISIIIPCHRVIGAKGRLVGYAGGLWRKKWLLEFENPQKTILFSQ